jgi:hypothetical protein
MGWVWHVASKEEPLNVHSIWVQNLKERDLKKFRLRWEENTVVLAKGSCEYGTELLGSSTGVELLDELSDQQLLKRTLGHAVIWW